jgi:2-iminobutanoate/2-iminopropanoate deaminase
MKSIVSTDRAPSAIGPYSQAVWGGDLLFCSGQTPLDPATGALVEGDAATQADRVLLNIRGILESQGLSMANILKATVFATDMGDFAAVNQVYAGFFAADPPARSFVQVAALPKGAKVEIEVIARKG